MEEILVNIVSIKDEVRKKLFENFECCIYSKTFEYSIYSERLQIEEINFFRNLSRLVNDEEFDKLIKKYEYLNFLISSIINEEED